MMILNMLESLVIRKMKNRIGDDITMMNVDDNMKLINYSELAYLEFSKKEVGKTLEEIFNDNYIWYDPIIISDKTPKPGNKKEDLEKHKEYLKTEYEDYKILKVERDDKTGFYAVALQSPDGEIVVSYKGSDFDFVYNDWGHNILELPDNYVTDQGQQASKFLEDVLEEFDGNVTIAGHSLGGFLALEVAINNVGYIDRIDKVYAFDAPGFMQEFIDNNEDTVKIFLEENKIFETEMTFISRLMHKLQDENLNSIIREDRWKGILEAAFVHPIGKFRKLYHFEDCKEIFRDGRLKYKSSEELGDKFTYLAEAMQIKPNSYKDIKTGLTMQVTLSRETLGINEFLKIVAIF